VDRIAIVGCGGSGKSHVARALGARLGISPVHLDALYYGADWTPLGQVEFAARQRTLVAAPRWIIDGNYAASLPIRLQAADTVIFLDLPAWVCLWGIAQRRFRHGGGQHATIGVYDRINWSFLRYVAGYRRHMAPRVCDLIRVDAGPAEVVVLRNRRAVHRPAVPDRSLDPRPLEAANSRRCAQQRQRKPPRSRHRSPPPVRLP
jgi:adenylate kinase family enzyme